MKLNVPTAAVLRAALASAVLFVALTFPLHVLAGAVFKCDGPNGQIAFTNKPGTFTHCTKVSDYAEPPPSAKPAENAAPGAPHSDYRSAAGAATVASPAPPDDGRFEVHRGAVYKVSKTNGITEYTNVKPRG